MEEENDFIIQQRMENGAKDGGSQDSLKKPGSSRPIDSGVDSGLYTSDTDSNSRSLSSQNSGEVNPFDSSVSGSSISNHRAIHSNSQLHCSSSLSTTRHVHSTGNGTGSRHSACSIESSMRLSSSINSSDSGFSDKRRSSLSDVRADVPAYYPLFRHVIRPRKNASAFPVKTDLVVVDYESFHQFPFQSTNVAEKLFGIEIYHNSTPTAWRANRPVTEQMCRAISTAEIAARKVKPIKELTMDTLERIQILGRGGYAHVELMRDTEGRSYALKCINKSRVVAAGQRRHVKAEREILMDIDSKFILKLFKTFRDKKYVYLLTEALLGGELFTLMKRSGPLDEHKAKFAIGCVLEAIEYLHSSMIVHRDVKPENMLLDEKGYVKLADFGFAKKLGRDGRTRTFCGTPGYLAPELLLKRPHGFPADFWSIGVFLFELLSCKSPFRRHTDAATYRMTCRGIRAVEFPACIKEQPADLIKKLCASDPEQRLGSAEGTAELRNSAWLKEFKFSELRRGLTISPLKPELSGPFDTSHFDEFSRASQDTPPDETSGWDEDF